MGHPLHTYLEAQILDRICAGESPDDHSEAYSPALYVQQRLLAFPFERYPDYCYPGHLITWPHMRWGQVAEVIRFCELLKQPTGSNKGKPIKLLGFQILILTCILGPEDAEERLRIARTITMTIARKNAKTALVAMLFLAIASLASFDLRIEEIRIGASDREQAGKLFEMLRNMILLDSDLGLNDLYSITPSRKTVTNKRSMTTLRVISSDAHRAHGSNDYGVLLDELGNLPDTAARQFYSVLSTGFGTQSEPLLLMFSTQAENDSHLFSNFVDQVKQINESRDVEGRIVGFIFDLPLEDDGTGLILQEDGRTVDFMAEKNWARSNPALEHYVEGGFRSLKDLRDKAKEARDMPSLSNDYRRYNLNQRVVSHSPFLSQVAWNRCVVEPIDSDFLIGCPLYVGGDLSQTTDLSCLAYVWLLDSGKLYARIAPYTPKEGLQQRAKDSKVPYDTWAQEGHLQALPGRTIDYSFMARDLADVDSEYKISQVGFDRYKWSDFKRECLAIEFDPYEAEEGDFWVPIGQGYIGMSPCIEALEKAVIEERILVERNPVATWAASNAVTVADPAGNRKFEKAKSYGRIDPLVALAMAVWLARQGDLGHRAGEEGTDYDSGETLMVV